jgi:predicted transcriptional regulator
MLDKGFKQVQIANELRITPAAVSQAVKKLRWRQ